MCVCRHWRLHLCRVLVQCRNHEVRFSPPPCHLSNALRCSSRCGKPRPRRDRISMATATYVYAMRINIIISKSARLGDHALSPLYSLFLFPCSPSARQGTHYFALFLCSLFFSFLFLCLSLSNTRSTIDRLRLYTFPFLLYTVCTRVSSTHVVACTQRDTWRRIKRVPWKDVAKLMGIVDGDRGQE